MTGVKISSKRKSMLNILGDNFVGAREREWYVKVKMRNSDFFAMHVVVSPKRTVPPKPSTS